MTQDVRLREIVFSSKQRVGIEDRAVPDIDRDQSFLRMFEAARSFTMTSKEVMFALYEAVRYVADRRIPGDFVECGIWRGGSALLAGLAFREFGSHPRLYLYDTFEGMTAPIDEIDIDVHGHCASDYINRYGDDGRWCYAGLNEVRNTFERHGFGSDQIVFIKGDVANTLPNVQPERISILRLDTDWYASTKHELEALYPRLASGGVLILDDYGHWDGARTAVDEYFSAVRRPLFSRVTNAVRMAVKT